MFRQKFDYLANLAKARVSHQQSKSGTSNFFINESLRCRTYVPARLRRRDTS